MTAFEWPLDRTGFPALPDPSADDYARKLLEQRAAAQLAVTVMWMLSGRQFGLYTRVVRPCREQRLFNRSVTLTSYVLSWETDRWVTWPCGCSGGRCEIGGPRAVHLPGPVYDVTEVRITDAVLDDDFWSIENNVLYRVGGIWPYQDLGRPLPETQTWSVTYRQGIPVGEDVQFLTGVLAKEFLAAFDTDGRCRLPRTVTTASRNGVSYRAYDPAVIYANGKTGLPEVDLWLAAVNPNHIAAAPSVI